MLTTYTPQGSTLAIKENPLDVSGARWIDLLEPTLAECHMVEQSLKLIVPTREEMQEIEITSRLYREENALFMTAWVVSNASTAKPLKEGITFILTPTALVTVRYTTPRPFAAFATRLAKDPQEGATSLRLLLGLLEAVVERAADVLEQLDVVLAETTGKVFCSETEAQDMNFSTVLADIGQVNDLHSKTEEGLVSLDRLITFLSHEYTSHMDKESTARLAAMHKDIHALTGHVKFLSNRSSFLLSATLGRINIQQNNIIKTFSIVAVVFLPPTLIASIYGMNFHIMPELDWQYGYVFALLLILFSAIGPYIYLKRKGIV
jgi:magnesium transporter